MTVQRLIAARTYDDGVAIKHGACRRTWRQYVDEAAATAAALHGILDRGKPAHVGVLMGNTPQMLTQMAAAALGGHVLCGVNTTRRGDALMDDVRRADCQVLAVDAEHRRLLADVDTTGIEVIDVSSERWTNLLSAASALEPLRVPDDNDTFMLVFTSGTSGNPKAVQVSHFMVQMAGEALVEKFGITAADTCYLPMPLFHSMSLVAGWSVALASGAAIAPATFSASNFLADVRSYGATYMTYVGKPLAYVLSTPERPDDADNPLRVAFGNEASDRDIAEFSRRFGVEVWDGFGATENAVIVTREPGTPPGSIGRGLDGVAVFNSETGTECPAALFGRDGQLLNGEEAIGELVNTQGSGMFKGYYNDSAATRDRMRGGMYWSGDLAYRDGDGWIYLAGRTADWMRVDGENIAAMPIERILLRHNPISRVAVYAVPDEVVGDAIMAAILPRPEHTLSPAEFERFLAAQPDLSPKAWPRWVRINSELPMTATYKILKRELIRQGISADNGTLWSRTGRGSTYTEVTT
ncbi:MAG TPA: fatty-acid--CoA ligase FadD1 [Jatrophihabitans sp.]